MKKALELLGIIVAGFIAFGSVGKVMHYPGANIMLVLGIGTFVFPFLVLFIANVIKEKTASLPLVIMAILLGGIYMIGTLFTLMHWPGGAYFSLMGMLGVLAALFILIIVELVKKPENRKLSVLTLIFTVIAVSLVYAATFRVPPAMVLNSFESLNQNFDLLNNTLSKVNTEDTVGMYTGIRNAGAVRNLRDNSDSLLALIKEDKLLLYRYAGGKDMEGYDRESLPRRDDANIATRIMEENGLGEKLKKKIDAYRNFLIANDSVYNIKTEASLLLSTKDTRIDNGAATWDYAKFHLVPLTGALASLSMIEAQVRACELRALEQMGANK